MTEIDYDGASIPALLELLASREPGERADAACALGDRLRTREIERFEPAVQERLVALLGDEVPIVKLEAAIALAEAHDTRATELLIEASRRRVFRLDAVRALGTLGDARAVAPLLSMLRRWLLPWADRLQAAAALCALGEAQGADYLEARMRSRRDAERAAAIHFLGESRHPRARGLLEPLLADAAEPMRDVAARALGLLGDPAARPALERAREHADPTLREDIDQALSRLLPGGKPA